MLKGSRLLTVLPTLGGPWTAKVLATEALPGAAKAPTEGHEENEGSVNECNAHSCKTKAE